MEPMECLAVTKISDDSAWVYEIKLDRYRAIAVNSDGKVNLYSRRHNSSTSIIRSSTMLLATSERTQSSMPRLNTELFPRSWWTYDDLGYTADWTP